MSNISESSEPLISHLGLTAVTCVVVSLLMFGVTCIPYAGIILALGLFYALGWMTGGSYIGLLTINWLLACLAAGFYWGMSPIPRTVRCALVLVGLAVFCFAYRNGARTFSGFRSQAEAEPTGKR